MKKVFVVSVIFKIFGITLKTNMLSIHETLRGAEEGYEYLLRQLSMSGYSQIPTPYMKSTPQHKELWFEKYKILHFIVETKLYDICN